MEKTVTGAALATVALVVGMGAAEAQEAQAFGIFQGHGVVKAVQSGTGALTLSHEDIRGFMPAMEMMYRVRSAELSQDLHPGDVIDFKIDAAKYVIIDVRRVSQAK